MHDHPEPEVLQIVDATLDRLVGSTTNSTIGLITTSQTVAAAANAGYLCHPVSIRPNFLVNVASRVKVLLAPLISGFNTTEFIRLVLAYTITRNNFLIDQSLTFDYIPPANWQATNPQIVTIDNGLGYTFGPGTFQLGDFLGMRLQRIGSADTFPNPVKMSDSLRFEYATQP